MFDLCTVVKGSDTRFEGGVHQLIGPDSECAGRPAKVADPGRIAQLVRALPSHGRGPQFESVYAHPANPLQLQGIRRVRGSAGPPPPRSTANVRRNSAVSVVPSSSQRRPLVVPRLPVRLRLPSQAMSIDELAVDAAAGYFLVFGAGFIVRPELVERFSLHWSAPAGRTEVRCYYGAVSWALAAFLIYLSRRGLVTEALTGVLFLAVAVLVTRVIGTLVDGGRNDDYTKVAIPVEAMFVLAVAAVRFL